MRRSGLKLGLAAVGAVLFLVGVRRDDATLRWVGIGWFVAAFLSRFLDRGASRERDGEREDGAARVSATEGGSADG